MTARLYIRREQDQRYHHPDSLEFGVRENGKNTLQTAPANITRIFLCLKNKTRMLVLFSVFGPDNLRQHLSEEDNVPVCHEAENTMDTCSISIGRNERRHVREGSGALDSKMASDPLQYN